MPNPAQAAKSEPFAPVKRIEGASIPSIYAQRLSMDPKYNVATCVEELGCNNTYRRSKHLSKRAKVPNLAQAAKSEPFAPVKVYKAHPFLQYMPKGHSFNICPKPSKSEGNCK